MNHLGSSMLLEQSAAQQQIITEKMLQSVHVLQLGVTDLAAYLRELSVENPVVEIEEASATQEQDERIQRLEWINSTDEQNRSFYSYEYGEGRDPLAGISVDTGEYLEDYLISQLLSADYSPEDMHVFRFIALSLDHNGFYTGGISEITRCCGVSATKAQNALNIMRELDPAGVCAENLSDCLCLQLKRRHLDGDLEFILAKYYLNDLALNRIQKIARQLSVSPERVLEARGIISSLNPRPSNGFSDRRNLRYITPDVTVVDRIGFFDILINDSFCPAIYINRDYLQMLKAKDTPETVREYLQKKLQQAEQIQIYVARRKSTLQELTRCIVNRQEAFFANGQKELLVPFQKKEAAEELHVHESTISRAVKDKYLQCSWGVFPLDFFFLKTSLPNASEENLTPEKVRKVLAELVASEDYRHPFSDDRLRLLLAEHDIHISRRTVAKYRAEMNIPDSRNRTLPGKNYPEKAQ